jgi:uracil-DNA glycosylase
MDLLDKVHPDWMEFFNDNLTELKDILAKIDFKNETIFPKKKDIFRSLFYFGPCDVKLSLISQDPYINSEIHDGKVVPQAMGLSFSVPKKHKKIPPSLQNIFKEIKNCYPDFNIPSHGLLKRWARKEKMLLLNSALTVLEGKSNSHAHLWASFTDKIIKYVSDKNPSCVFLLMGAFAQKKAQFIDNKKHKIFTTVHPSPLSAYNGFFGCQVFKKINDYLKENNLSEINW